MLRLSAVAQSVAEHASLIRGMATLAVRPFIIQYAAPMNAVRPNPLSQNTSTPVRGGRTVNVGLRVYADGSR